MSAAVNSLLLEKKIIEGKKVKASKDKKSKKAPAQAPAEAPKTETPAAAETLTNK